MKLKFSAFIAFFELKRCSLQAGHSDLRVSADLQVNPHQLIAQMTLPRAFICSALATGSCCDMQHNFLPPLHTALQPPPPQFLLFFVCDFTNVSFVALIHCSAL